jgi:hypothetical protein
MRRKVVTSPYVLRAEDVRVCRGVLTIVLSPSIAVEVLLASLGRPWTVATKRAAENVSLRSGGHCIFWEDLDEVIALDEWLPSALGIDPAALLGKRNLGKKASPAKARAARKNGKRGGRPRKAA